MTLYIAFLRGINVGGHRVKMEKLRELFRELGFSNVRTYIQTGNVFFESPETDCEVLTAQIEAHLLQSLGYEVPTFLRIPAKLEPSLQLDPFYEVEVTPDTRLMVVFTRESLQPSTPLPIVSAKTDMEIVAVTEGEVYLVIRLIDGKWGNLAPFMKKAFGVNATITTRFYDTTLKILQAAQDT
ncbi:DUF1697 domain-containing protein [bacterium]|nr:MAG: DUF1697 domain-containing protein [bacterium]